MKRIVIVSFVLLLMAAAYQAGDIIKADRFVVFNDRGMPVFVATTNQIQGGEFVVSDAQGNEVFAIHQGQIVAPGLDIYVARATYKYLKAKGVGTGPQSKAKQNSHKLQTEQSDLLGPLPVFKIELVAEEELSHRAKGHPEARAWRIVCRVTNQTRSVIKNASLGLIERRFGPRPGSFSDRNKSIANLPPGESDLVIFYYWGEDQKQGPKSLRIKVSEVKG